MLALVALLGCAHGDLADPSALGVEERVSRIVALQDGVTSKAEERELLALFTGVRGAELRRVKQALDARMTPANLDRLVYSDIDDPSIRETLLVHLQRASTEDLPERHLRVLSDIDDTVFARLNDDRYDHGTVYPGVHALYAALAAESGVDTEAEGFVTFVSARPGDRSGAYEEATLSMLRKRGFERATLLAGTLIGLRSHDAMAEGKYEHFARYHALYPEYAFVFVGDNGHGDADFGARILAETPDDVRAVLIHDVGGGEDVSGERLRYFDTFAGAAVHSHDLGLLSKERATEVIEATRAELSQIPFEDEAARGALLAALEAEASRLPH